MNHRNASQEVYEIRFQNWGTSVAELLDLTDLSQRIKNHSLILLKPNLVNTDPAPITTPPELVEAIIKYLLPFGIPLAIAEGTAIPDYTTSEVFEILGYQALAEKYQIPLIDFNLEPSTRLQLESCVRWPEMHLPTVALDSFLLNIPQLKAHSLSGVTLSMKNMMGLAPPDKYQQGGYWKKSSFHREIDRAVFELNRYRKADFTVLDATIGMAESHLGGPTCNPPVNRLIAGADPVAVDKKGCELLNKDWRTVGHIRLADAFFL